VPSQSGHLLSYLFEYVGLVRADRLVAIVLLFQLRGRLTAAELAEQLETSERTIRRDLEALCMAGVPLYSQRGRGGGWTLFGGYRIDLTGLTAKEAQALFIATGPDSVADLGPGVSEGLTAARRKVLAALPGPLRAQVETAGTTLLVDQSAWGRSIVDTVGAPVADDPHLSSLRSAVLAGVQAVVNYEPPGRLAEDRQLHPLGLVCKRGVWYLVATAEAGLRTYRLSRVRWVEVTDEPVERPVDFDLAETWRGAQQRLSAQKPAAIVVQVAVAPDSLRRLRAMVGKWWPIEETGTTDDGRAEVTIHFPNASVAAAELVGLNDHAEVIAPQQVCTEMAELGRRLVRRYGDTSVPSTLMP
jgi:predicted DNA-binding transcriptional regulator YafY